jgi:hypothetical protein
MVALMGALMIVITLGAGILVAALRVERSAAATLERLNHRILLADLFRTDVGQAVAAPEGVEKVNAGPACLILRRADGSHVFYRWAEDHLERGVLPETAAPRPVPLGLDCAGVEFVRGGPEQRLITLRLREAPGPSGIIRTHDICATRGGDLP